jgi:membrane-bound lytic murein transglycosylase D
MKPSPRRHFAILCPARLFALFCAAFLPVFFPIAAATPVDMETASSVTAVMTEEISPPLRIPQAIDLTLPPADLWARVRNGFVMPNLNDEIVLRHQQYYQSHPEYLRRMVERSRLYLHHIVRELEQRGMPTELALLPMVESAYNPLAQSPAQASGLWQFIPSTGRVFKLEQNWWQDQRRDIVASTSAALDYLQYLYELHGDWHLALASYNWGEGAVGRAMAKNAAKGLFTDYASLTLPNETRNYVPKLQALKNIFSNPGLVAKLGIPDIPDESYFRTLTTEAAMDVGLAARFADMSLEEFAALNPAHNRPVIPAQSTLVLPADRLERFRSALLQHDESLTSWRAYMVRPGETLEEVAPRFGIALADLKRVNGLHGAIQVNPGFTLLVPAQGEVALAHEDFRALAEQGRAVTISGRTHVVKKGETLMSIARKYRMTLAALKNLNRGVGNRIRAGGRLTVSPGGARPAEARVASGSMSKTSAQKTNGKPVSANKKRAQTRVTHHKVRKGDTLFSIARRYNVDLADLKRWNRQAGNPLKVGAMLSIRM